LSIREKRSMNSAIAHVKMAKKQKSVVKGIIRRGQKKNVIIIINNKMYFVSITALTKILNGIEEKTPIFGY